MNPLLQKFASVQNIDIIEDYGSAEGYVADTNAEQLQNWLDRFNFRNDAFVADLRIKYDRFAVLNNINVNEEFRGRGQGDKLLGEFLEKAGQKGAGVVLLVADTAEEQAVGFDLIDWYERNDFEEIQEVIGGHLMMYGLMNPKTATKTAADIGTVKNIISEMMSVLASGLPHPEAKIINQTTRALGQDSWLWGKKGGEVWGADNTTIEVQKRVLGHEDTLRRIIAHELCHHEVALLIAKPKLLEVGYETYKRYGSILGPNGHGKEWKAVAERFNAKYGENFVTETSDQNMVIDEQGKEIFVLINQHAYGHNKKRLGWEWAVNLSLKAKEFLNALDWTSGEYKLVKTTDHMFTNSRAKIQRFGGWALARTPEQEQKLQDLWEKAPQVKIACSAAQDELDAIEGAMKTAKRYGPVYHGTYGEWSDKIQNDKYKIGKFFSSDALVAQAYGSFVHECYLTINKPLIVDAKGENYSSIPTPKALKGWVGAGVDTVDTDNIADFASKHGYDGVIVKNVIELHHQVEADDYIVFNPSQVKVKGLVEPEISPYTANKFHKEELQRRWKAKYDQSESELPDKKSADDTTRERRMKQYAAFIELADKQRGTPESAMLKIQHDPLGAGVYSFAVEHTGDLTHRMNEQLSIIRGTFGYETVKDKVEKVLRYLERSYGFEREMQNNLKNDYEAMKDEKLRGISYDEALAKFRVKCNNYADAHAALTVYNRPQELCRDAAVALGRWEFDKARSVLNMIKRLLNKGPEAWASAASEGAPIDKTAKVGPHKHSSVLFVLPSGSAAKTMEIAERIPDEELGVDGREDDPHITIRYGVKDDVDFLGELIGDQKPFSATLGKTHVFEVSESSAKQAPVVVEVDAPELHALHDLISEKMGTRADDFEYKPHVTLAYVNPEFASKYDGLDWCEGISFEVSSVVLSKKSGNRVSVEFGMEVKVGSHKTPPLSDTQYENPEMGEESNAYANLPERVKGVEELPSLESLAPSLFKTGSVKFVPPTLKDFYKQKYGLPLPRDKDELMSLDWKYDEAVGQVETLEFPLTVYRAVEVPEGQEIRLNDVGIYWATNPNAADAYWGGSSLWSGQGGKGGKGRLVILTAEVQKEDDVDPWQTFVANFENPEEYEVTLRSGARLKLIQIDDEKPKKVNQMITASSKEAFGDASRNLPMRGQKGIGGQDFPELEKIPTLPEKTATGGAGGTQLLPDEVEMVSELGISGTSGRSLPKMERVPLFPDGEDKEESKKKSAATKPRYLYHGTARKNLDDILKNGLKAGASESHIEWTHAVYLACDAATAKGYSGHKGEKDWVVLRIDTQKLRESELRPDDYDFPDLWGRGSMWEESSIPTEIKERYESWAYCPWYISLEYTCQVAYLGDIPPDAITVVSPKVGKTASDYDLYMDIAEQILNEYQANLGNKGYKQKWEVVPAARLIKIWNDYAKTSVVRDEKGIDDIAWIITKNIYKLQVNTLLCGHESDNPVEFAKGILGDELPEDFFDQQESFFEDEKGAWRLSDYAMKPLVVERDKLEMAQTPEQKLQIVDRILNIVHARSDLSSWFVQGGTKTLNQLAGTDKTGAMDVTASFDWMYHVTFSNYLDSISSHGLVPNVELGITGGGEKGKVFVTEALDISRWLERAETWAYHRSDNPAVDGLVPVVLRFPREDVQGIAKDEVGQGENAFGAYKADHVPPDHIELWNGKVWGDLWLDETIPVADDEGYLLDGELRHPKLAFAKKRGEVYLLHFDINPKEEVPSTREDASNPFHARHYLGWAENAQARIQEHYNATSGVKLIEAIRARGISFTVARIWPEQGGKKVDRNFERRLKNQGGLSRHCPICKSLGIDRDSLRKKKIEIKEQEQQVAPETQDVGPDFVEKTSATHTREDATAIKNLLWGMDLRLNLSGSVSKKGISEHDLDFHVTPGVKFSYPQFHDILKSAGFEFCGNNWNVFRNRQPEAGYDLFQYTKEEPRMKVDFFFKRNSVPEEGFLAGVKAAGTKKPELNEFQKVPHPAAGTGDHPSEWEYPVNHGVTPDAADRTDITKIINERVRAFIDAGSKSAWGINNGECQEFAEDIASKVKGAEIFESGFGVWEDAPEPTHFFIRYNGRWYDAEAPRGVKSWKDLPIFRGKISARKQAAAGDLANLRSYLTLSRREMGEELARNFTGAFKEFIGDQHPDLLPLFDAEEEYIDDYTPIPDQVLEDFLEQFGAKAQEWDPAGAPTFLTVEYRGDVKNAWLVHFTDHPDEIAKGGFKYGMDRVETLALTTYFKDEAKKFGGYNFALDPNNRRLVSLGESYGKHCVLFRANGIKTYHYGDEFEQIIFWGKDAKNIIPIFSDGYAWTVGEDVDGNPLFESDDLHQVVSYAETNWTKLVQKAPKQKHAASEEIPLEPGKTPIPAGTVRLYHYTKSRESFENIKTQGLLAKYALGDDGSGKGPSAGIWASTRAPENQHLYAEFYLYPEQISHRADYPRQGENPEAWAQGYHHIIANGDVPLNQIVAFHEPFHTHVRYLMEDNTWEELMERDPKIVDEANDGSAFSKAPDGEAVRWMVRNHGTGKKASMTKQAMHIEVPQNVRDHFWDEPPAHNLEFWAFKGRPSVLPNEKVYFTFDKMPVAETVVLKIEKPGESKCELTGKYEKHWKLYWEPAKFVKYAALSLKTAADQQHLFPNSQDAKFQQWFKGSKVVDQKGNPLPVYHGTRSSENFNEFSVDGPPLAEDSYEGETTSSGSGPDPTAYMGAHFTPQPDVANQFALGQNWMNTRYEGEEPKPRVMQVYLRITNPKDFGSEDNLREYIYQGQINEDEVLDLAMQNDGIIPWEPEQEEAAQQWYQKYQNDQGFRVEANRYLFERHRSEEGEDDMLRSAAYDLAQHAKQRLRNTGHDGIHYQNSVEGGTAWTVFDPNQVKSAWASDFSPNSNQFTASVLQTAASLSLKPNKPELEAFMDDFRSGTGPNPLGHRDRVWNEQIVIEVRPFDGRIHISDIMSLDRGKGNASKALGWLCSLADKHGVAMSLTPDAFGDADGLDDDQLTAWYARYGFKTTMGRKMVREPQQPKTAAPKSIWYHGTSIKNLPSVMSQGLMPEGTDKVWAEDPDASAAQVDRTAYGGIYVTQNLLTATGSPKDTQENGGLLLCILELQPNTMYLDEDSIVGALNAPIKHLSDNGYHVISYYLVATQGGASKEWMDEIEGMKSDYMYGVLTKWQREFEKKKLPFHADLKARLMELLPKVWLAALARKAAHYKDNYIRAWDQVFYGTEKQPQRPDVNTVLPSPAEGEKQFRDAVEPVTRSLRLMARPETGDTGFNINTARITEPVGFTGSNRILALLEIKDTRKTRGEDFKQPAQMLLHWGAIPQDFWTQWNNRHGGKYELIDARRKISSTSASIKTARTFTPEEMETEAAAFHDQFGLGDDAGQGPASNYTWTQVDQFPVDNLDLTPEEWKKWFDQEKTWAAEGGRPENYFENMEKWWTTNPDEHMVVVHGTDGKYYVWEGTHRQAISKIHGMKTVPVFLGEPKPVKHANVKFTLSHKEASAQKMISATVFEKRARMNRISEQDAQDRKMFGPVYHGTTEDRQEQIGNDGFKVYIGDAGSGDVQHGYEGNQPYHDGIPAPVHHLGYGVYFTTAKGIAKTFAGGTTKGMRAYYLDVPNLETINFGAPKTMMKWWISQGYDPQLAKKNRVEATKQMTEGLKSKYDAVWYKGKGMYKLLDGDQVCVFDTNRIYEVDSTMSNPGDVGSKVKRKVDGMRGTIMKRENIEGMLQQYPAAASWIKPNAKYRYTVKWTKGGTDMNVQDVDVDFLGAKGKPVTSSLNNVTLSDLYDGEIPDENEGLGRYLSELGTNDQNEVFYHQKFQIKTLSPEQTKQLKVNGDQTVLGIYMDYAESWQKQLVKRKMKKFDDSRVIVLRGGYVLDGNHHTIAAIQLNQPVHYIDLDEPLESEPKQAAAAPQLQPITSTTLSYPLHGRGWVTPDGKNIPVDGSSHGDVARALGFKNKGQWRGGGQSTGVGGYKGAELFAMEAGYIRYVVESAGLAATGVKVTILEFYSQADVQRRFGALVRYLAVDTPQVGVEWHFPAHGYETYSLAEAEEKYSDGTLRAEKIGAAAVRVKSLPVPKLIMEDCWITPNGKWVDCSNIDHEGAAVQLGFGHQSKDATQDAINAGYVRVVVNAESFGIPQPSAFMMFKDAADAHRRAGEIIRRVPTNIEVIGIEAGRGNYVEYPLAEAEERFPSGTLKTGSFYCVACDSGECIEHDGLSKIAREGYNDEGFWAGDGNAASGVLPICPTTKRICLAWRSPDVHIGDCWGTIGGACKEGMSLSNSAKAELKEETGFGGGVTMYPAFVFQSGSFSYHNFIGVVGSEFSFRPQSEHHWETTGLEWFTLEQIYQMMEKDSGSFHPGLISLFKSSKNDIERLVSKAKDVTAAYKGGSPSAYTIGRGYDAYFETQEAPKKSGHHEDYDGGWVWRTREEAQAFIDSKKEGVDDSYKVYGLSLPNGWATDVSPEPAADGIRRLLTDSPLLQLAKTAADDDGDWPNMLQVFPERPDVIETFRYMRPFERDRMISGGSRRAQKTGASSKFSMSEALEEINDKFPVASDNRWLHQFIINGQVEATFDLEPVEGRLRLRAIQSMHPKNGVGTILLQRITRIADKYGIEMELTASPVGLEDDRIDKDKLQEWYRSHQFEDEQGIDPALGYMVRPPKKASGWKDEGS